jgi:hypothetical protein
MDEINVRYGKLLFQYEVCYLNAETSVLLPRALSATVEFFQKRSDTLVDLKDPQCLLDPVFISDSQLN